MAFRGKRSRRLPLSIINLSDPIGVTFSTSWQISVRDRPRGLFLKNEGTLIV
jgi:hypothetical protein